MSTSVVADASVALKWVVTEAGSEQANTLLSDLANGTITIVAPAHLVGEVANGLRKRVSQGVLSRDDALAAIDTLDALELDYLVDSARWFRTLRAAMDWQVTTYDALYVLLALDVAGELVTGDARLVEAARANSLPVRPLTP